MENIKKILVINFGGIGDEILFLPTLISLKKEFPDSTITLALEPRSKGIKDLTDIIDEVFLIDVKGTSKNNIKPKVFKNASWLNFPPPLRGRVRVGGLSRDKKDVFRGTLKSKHKYFELLKLIFLAQKGRFDLVISSGANKFISILLFLTGIKFRYGYNSGKLSEILLTKAIPLNKNQYACDMYHDLITPITKTKTKLPQIKLEPVQKEPNTILIHPGVSKLSVQMGMIKTIPAEKWAKVIDLLLEKGKKVILAGGPDDKDCIEAIRTTLLNKESENFVDYYGKTKSLIDLAKLISSSEKFVCSDSAPLHIAVALKTQTYVIFGPTDEKKLIPQSPDVIAIKQSDDCPLKPCLWEKRQTTCENIICLDIKTKDIVETILL